MTTTLAYHKVDHRFELGLTTVDTDAFARQMFKLREMGYAICSSETYLSLIEKNTVCLTFDDGYDCFFRNVVPFLSSIEASATTFVITDYVGKTNAWDLRLSARPFRHMSAAQLREISGLGFEIGSHTCSHRDLTRLDPRTVREELTASKKLLEDVTGKEVSSVSFPYGRHNDHVAGMAFEVGYKRLFGLGSKVAQGVLERVPVYRFDGTTAVLRKIESDRYEILKSDFIHSFSVVSALISTRITTKIL